MTPSGFAFGETARSASTRGVLNDALSIYFGDATLASAFVVQWCVGSKVETVGGVFQVREGVLRDGGGPGTRFLRRGLLAGI